eukprot:1235661-Pleurochrysis_carterae.AAC.1
MCQSEHERTWELSAVLSPRACATKCQIVILNESLFYDGCAGERKACAIFEILNVPFCLDWLRCTLNYRSWRHSCGGAVSLADCRRPTFCGLCGPKATPRAVDRRVA